MNEELRLKLEELGKSIDAKILEANKGLSKTDDVDTLKALIMKDLTPLMENYTKLQDQLDTAEVELKKVKDSKSIEGETFESALLKAMEANRENIVKYFEGMP